MKKKWKIKKEKEEQQEKITDKGVVEKIKHIGSKNMLFLRSLKVLKAAEEAGILHFYLSSCKSDFMAPSDG